MIPLMANYAAGIIWDIYPFFSVLDKTRCLVLFFHHVSTNKQNYLSLYFPVIVFEYCSNPILSLRFVKINLLLGKKFDCVCRESNPGLLLGRQLS